MKLDITTTNIKYNSYSGLPFEIQFLKAIKGGHSCLRLLNPLTRCPQKKILVARVFSLQRQVIYQIKAKRLNYLIKDFISSNFKRRLSFLLSNSEVSSLLLKLQPFRVVKYSLPFYCIWLTDKRPKKGCEEICICLVLAELLHFKLKSRISSAIYAKKLT